MTHGNFSILFKPVLENNYILLEFVNILGRLSEPQGVLMHHNCVEFDKLHFLEVGTHWHFPQDEGAGRFVKHV